MDKIVLERIYGIKVSQAQVDGLNDCLEKFGILGPVQVAQFIAQVGVESGLLRYTKELGKDAYFDKYDTGKLAERLGNTPARYGDGLKYKGRGYIQVTGLYNYRSLSKAVGIDFVKQPELLEQEKYAWLSAGWYWKSRNLNDIAHDVVAVTKKINGGTNHLKERTELFEKAKLELVDC